MIWSTSSATFPAARRQWDRALAACGLQPLQQQGMGPHKTAAVRGTPEQFARLAAEPDLELSGLNLQNVFVALCGHGDEEG